LRDIRYIYFYQLVYPILAKKKISLCPIILSKKVMVENNLNAVSV